MKYSKMTLAHVFKLITENTELTEQELMTLTIDEIEDLRCSVSASLRTAHELNETIKKIKKVPYSQAINLLV